MAQAVSSLPKEKQLVFEKVEFDPLSNPDVFGLEGTNASSPVNVDSGWDSDGKKESSTTTHNQPADTNRNTSKPDADKSDDEMKVDSELNDEPDYDSIEAKLQRSKKKKKVDFRAEMTSDSQDIDDLLMFQSKERNEMQQISRIDEELLELGDDDLLSVEKKDKQKSIEQLLNETDNMFKELDIQTDIPADELDVNVADNFNFDQYINQQPADDVSGT